MRHLAYGEFHHFGVVFTNCRQLQDLSIGMFRMTIQCTYLFFNLDYQVTNYIASQVINISQVLIEFAELSYTSFYGYV